MLNVTVNLSSHLGAILNPIGELPLLLLLSVSLV